MGITIESSGLAELPAPNYQYITTTEEALRVLPEIERYDIIEVDSEDTGLDPLTARTVLLQIGVIGKSYVFDVRDGRVDGRIFKPILEGTNQLKLIQNAVYDYEVLKTNFGISCDRMYDTMLAEQLLYLGLHHKSSLGYLVGKYLGMSMPKETATSFSDYNQEYQEYQIRYAANDVSVLRDIYNLQLPKLKEAGLMRVAKLEFEFIKPLCEMELNGVLLDVPKWREILGEMLIERDKLRIKLDDTFNDLSDQSTLFGVCTMNLDSPVQLVGALNRIGVPVSSTDVKELGKHKNNPVVKTLLEYRKYEKFITTYGEPMIGRIHSKTGRLHTNLKQMVDTGRLSSSNPNLQNIPKEQKYRSCFIARPGYKLITSDMSAAELRIIANLSGEQSWVDIFNGGKDLHTISAAFMYGITVEEVIADKKLPDGDPRKKNYRSNSKAISFGLCYGLTKVGLALRLGISESAAQDLIDKYYKLYPTVISFLEESAKEAVLKGYTSSISGRRRYYALPNPSDPSFKKVRGSVERQGKNMKIQAGNADTIKQAMIYVLERIKPYDARLLLTVHDEIIVEVREDQVQEVKPIVEQSIVDGFSEFFKLVSMSTEALVGDCWLKG
jgi:DNA polymerase I-like protein with 3'-5' exonuclease and polymerase domains